jgi:serine/threonine protein kinase
MSFCGKKRVLSEDEKKHYQDALDGEFTIGEQLGRSGANSSAYLLTDKNGKNFVLKIPNDLENCNRWQQRQKKANELQNQYFGDYKGPIGTPQRIKKGDDFIVEELVAGKEFDPSIYETLSPIQKKKVAQDLGEFLSYTHQRTMTGKRVELHPGQQGFVTLKQTYDYFEPVLTDDEKKELKKEIQNYNRQKEAPEVLAYRDYRPSNMLWDDKKKKLSIIDFDVTGNASVYEDFTPSAALSTKISFQFWADVINAYNHAPKQNPLTIDLETVRRNFFIGIYHEMARCNIGRTPPEECVDIARYYLKRLDALKPTGSPLESSQKSNLISTIKKGKTK